MNAAFRNVSARNRVSRRRRVVHLGLGLLCLCPFAPAAMASALSATVGPGFDTFNLPGDGQTWFGFNFNGSDLANRVDLVDGAGGSANETFNISLNLTSAPALSGSGAPDVTSGVGLLTVRWENSAGLNTAGAPADSDWTGSDSILRLQGSTSVQVIDSSTDDATFYEVVLGFTNPASGSAATINYEWPGFNDAAGGNFSVYLDPGQQDLVLTPIPTAVWLFGSGLVALIGVGRRHS